MAQEPQGYASLCSVIANAQEPNYSAVTCPMLILAGEDDRTAPISASESILKRYVGSACTTFCHSLSSSKMWNRPIPEKRRGLRWCWSLALRRGWRQDRPSSRSVRKVSRESTMEPTGIRMLKDDVMQASSWRRANDW